MVRFTGLSNQCTFGLDNQQDRRYAPDTELERIEFQPFPSSELVWQLSTQVNDGIIAAYMNVFDPGRGRRRRFMFESI